MPFPTKILPTGLYSQVKGSQGRVGYKHAGKMQTLYVYVGGNITKNDQDPMQF